MTLIADVYQQYQHLDRLLTDAAMLLNASLKDQMLRDCWAAIKAIETNVCHWVREDDEADSYRTDCGQLWEFTAGGPAENGVRFCLYCGRALKV